MCHNLRNGGRGPPATLLTTPGLLQRYQQALKPDTGSESRLLPTPPAFDARLRGVPVGVYCHPVRRGKVMDLPDGEKVSDTITRFDRIHERDGHTDIQTPQSDRKTAYGRAYA